MRVNRVLSQDSQVSNALQTINYNFKNKSRNENRMLNNLEFNSEKLPTFNARIRNILDGQNEIKENKILKKSKKI